MKESMQIFMQEFLKGALEEYDGKTREEKTALNAIPVTEKSYDELTELERENVIQKLLCERYYYIKAGVHIAYGREKSLQQSVFLEEFYDCKVLLSLGFDVYLLPNGCAAKDGQFKEFADAVVDNRLLELKHIESPKKVGDRYQNGRHQGQDVFIDIRPPISEKEALKQIFTKIRRIKEHDNSENFAGRLFLHFATEHQTKMYTINRFGVVKERPL